MIKRLTFVAVAAALLYSGYWFIGARTVRTTLADTIADMRAEGWEIAYDDLSVVGFPNRFDTTLSAPRVAPPAGAPAWSAPDFTVYALSYRPNEVIALFPAMQEVALPDQTLTLSSTGMRASARVSASRDLPLDNVTVQTGALSVSSNSGWEVILDAGLAAFRAAGPEANAYDLYLRLDAPGLDGMDVPGLSLDEISADARAVLDAPLDRYAASPSLVSLDLRQIQIVSGSAGLVATGRIDFAQGSAGDGQIDVTVTQWETLIEIFETAGILTPGRAQTLRSAAMAMSGGGSDFTAPITVTDGALRFGFVPLGRLP